MSEEQVKMARVTAGYAISIVNMLMRFQVGATIGGLSNLAAMMMIEAGIQPDEITPSLVQRLVEECEKYVTENDNKFEAYIKAVSESVRKEDKDED